VNRPVPGLGGGPGCESLIGGGVGYWVVLGKDLHTGHPGLLPC